MKKVYASVCETYWELGDEHYNGDTVIGIFENPEDAYNEGMRYMYENFEYDLATDTYYGNMADEVWIRVYEYELGKAAGGEVMIKNENGEWINAMEDIRRNNHV